MVRLAEKLKNILIFYFLHASQTSCQVTKIYSLLLFKLAQPCKSQESGLLTMVSCKGSYFPVTYAKVSQE